MMPQELSEFLVQPQLPIVTFWVVLEILNITN